MPSRSLWHNLQLYFLFIHIYSFFQRLSDQRHKEYDSGSSDEKWAAAAFAGEPRSLTGSGGGSQMPRLSLPFDDKVFFHFLIYALEFVGWLVANWLQETFGSGQHE